MIFPNSSLMRKYLIILILALIGVANAWYLTYETLEIFRAQTAGGPLGALPCDISSSLSCSGILSNPRAIIFTINGFKVAFPMIAAFVYPLLALIALCGYVRKSLTEAKILSVLAFGGMCFNGYVISQEFIV